jgi:dienelactone hydrolase
VVLKNPANRHKTQMLTPEEFHYGFTNTLTLEDSRPIYDRLAVPGPGRVLFQAAFANLTPHAVTTVSRHNSSRAPLLFVANGKDHTVPAVVTRAAYKIQNKTGALTELREYPDRTHSTFGQDGWEEVADYCLDWAVRNART